MKKNAAKFIYVLVNKNDGSFLKSLKEDTDNIVDVKQFPNLAAARKFRQQHRLVISHAVYRATLNILLLDIADE